MYGIDVIIIVIVKLIIHLYNALEADAREPTEGMLSFGWSRKNETGGSFFLAEVSFYRTHCTAEGSVFGAASLWFFVYEISLEPPNGFAPNSHGRVFGPSLRQVWRSTVKITKDKKRHFSSLSAACVRFMFAQTSLASSFGSLNNFVKPHLSCCCHVSCLYGLSVCQVFCLNQDLLVTVMFCFYRLKLYRNYTNRY